MLQKLSLFTLAPVLLYQGKRVRAQTIRLPEATGERSGFSPATKGAEVEKAPLSVLVLGDSAAAGVGCETQTEAVCGQWVNGLQQQRSVHWQLIAQSSLTCRGVLALLKDSDLTIPTKPLNKVLISVGVNDVTRRTPLAQWKQDLQALTDYLTTVLHTEQIIYTSLPPMHAFPALPQPLRWYIGQQAKQLNRALQTHCQGQPNTHFLNFDIPFEAKYMAKDGYHPSKEAAKIWATYASRI